MGKKNKAQGTRYKVQGTRYKDTRKAQGKGTGAKGNNSNLLTTDQYELVDNYFDSTNG